VSSDVKLYSTSKLLAKKFELPPVPQKPKEQKFTLRDQNDKSLGMFTKKEAEKMARALDYKLLLVQHQNNNGKSYFKYVTGMQLHEERMKSREEKKSAKAMLKGEKSVTIKDKISEHDLKIRINQIEKWLKSRHVVEVILQGGNSAELEHVSNSIEEGTKSFGNTKNKKSKVGRITFSIQPKEEIESDEVTSTSTDN